MLKKLRELFGAKKPEKPKTIEEITADTKRSRKEIKAAGEAAVAKVKVQKSPDQKAMGKNAAGKKTKQGKA